MKDAGFTRQERTFIAVMRIWAVALLFTALLFAALPDVLLDYVNDIGRVFAGWNSPPHAPVNRFWAVQAVSFELVLAYACMLAGQRPLVNRDYARLVILGKLAAAAGLASMLLLDSAQFYYAVGLTIDGLIGIITWRTYSRAVFSRNA